MLPFSVVFQNLFKTFDGSALTDFRAFLKEHPRVNTWLIAADFCLRDNEKTNSVFAFTVIPYDALIEDMQSEIAAALPKDIKKTREISSEGLALLANDRRFHLAFIFKDHPDLFPATESTTRLTVARDSLQMALDQLSSAGRTKKQLKRLKGLKQKSLAKTFNVDLLSDMTLLAHLFCFVTLVLLRERPTAAANWFPDRDSMTSWEDGAVWDIALESLAGLAEHFSIARPSRSPGIGVAPQGAAGPLWFDELIRIPDYIAGIFSSWDFEQNAIDLKPKYKQLATDVVASARNFAVFRVRYDSHFQVGRLVFAPEPH